MNAITVKELSTSELIELYGGGFAHDVGSAIGWLIRANSFGPSNPAGILYANAVWIIQHS